MASSHPAIAKMLEHYALNSKEESVDALREILQEIVLLGLWLLWHIGTKHDMVLKNCLKSL